MENKYDKWIGDPIRKSECCTMAYCCQCKVVGSLMCLNRKQAALTIEYMLERNEKEMEERKKLSKPIFVVERATRFSDVDFVCQDNNLR